MRFAAFADLHARCHQPGTSSIAARRSRLMPRLFQQGLRDARERGAELIAVLGDLLDVPGYILSGDDYYDYGREQWDRDIEADYHLFRELLDGCGLPWVALPGNHDKIAVMQGVLPPAPVLDRGGCRFVSFWDRDFYANVPRRLDRERALLERVLAEPGSPPQIHLQHYVITPELNQGWPHTYLEGEHLTRTLADSGRVVLAVSGHYHLGTELLREGGCAFTTAPAFCEFPHRYRLFDVASGTVTMTEVPLLDRPVEQGRPCVFLDRDGVLNVQPSWRSGPEELTPMPGAGTALRSLKEAGYALVVVSSQSAVGAGYVTTAVVSSVFDHLARALAADGASWDAYYFSTGAGSWAVHPSLADDPHGKPRPDYLLRAADGARSEPLVHGRRPRGRPGGRCGGGGDADPGADRRRREHGGPAAPARPTGRGVRGRRPGGGGRADPGGPVVTSPPRAPYAPSTTSSSRC
ncbi:MAG: metallophosphoesterase [Armatimonadetes bacterium]|nr:metallophosphoesterase [Armatimonadota bacterium]